MSYFIIKYSEHATPIFRHRSRPPFSPHTTAKTVAPRAKLLLSLLIDACQHGCFIRQLFYSMIITIILLLLWVETIRMAQHRAPWMAMGKTRERAAKQNWHRQRSEQWRKEPDHHATGVCRVESKARCCAVAGLVDARSGAKSRMEKFVFVWP